MSVQQESYNDTKSNQRSGLGARFRGFMGRKAVAATMAGVAGAGVGATAPAVVDALHHEAPKLSVQDQRAMDRTAIHFGETMVANTDARPTQGTSAPDKNFTYKIVSSDPSIGGQTVETTITAGFSALGKDGRPDPASITSFGEQQFVMNDDGTQGAEVFSGNEQLTQNGWEQTTTTGVGSDGAYVVDKIVAGEAQDTQQRMDSVSGQVLSSNSEPSVTDFHDTTASMESYIVQPPEGH